MRHLKYDFKIILLLLIMSVFSCTSNHKESSTTEKSVEAKDTSINITQILIDPNYAIIDSSGDNKSGISHSSKIEYKVSSRKIEETRNCKKCEISIIHHADVNFQSLEYQDIYNVLCTIDTSCSNNAEFSEYSNEILHKILLHYFYDFVEISSRFDYLMTDYIYEEIANPLIDYDYQVLYNRIDSVGENNEVKRKILESLQSIN